MDLKAGIIGIIIILILLLVLVGVVYAGYRYISRKLNGYARMLFGTNTITEGLHKTEMEYAATPKSVASATGLYLPGIMKDFPEFHLDEMRERSDNVLRSYLRSIDEDNAALLTEGTNELKNKLEMKIEMLRNEGCREHFERIKLHRTEIYKYRKDKGRCSIVFQTAAEHVHYVDRDGQLRSGRKDRLEQAKYNVEVSYIQDRDMVEDLGDSGKALNCPNCGAPLPSLGAKKCAYCDSPVVEFNIRTWNFSDVELCSSASR